MRKPAVPRKPVNRTAAKRAQRQAKRRLSHGGCYVGLSPEQADIDLAMVSSRAPALAGDIGFRLFCLPRYSSHRSADHSVLVQRARHHLRLASTIWLDSAVGRIAAHVMRPDRAEPVGSVLVVHGWTSESSFMTALAEPLRRSGFHVVLVDCPAHGLSGGDRVSLIDCARAVLAVGDRLGPFDHVVAHSMGCLAALLAGRGGEPFAQRHDFKRYVLISTPNAFGEVMGTFAQERGLSPAAQRVYERHLERVAWRPITSLRADRFLPFIDRPALLIHADDDAEIPPHNAMGIAATCPKVRLLLMPGLGHRKILHAPPVIRAVIGYLKQAPTD
ncbi:MAG: alpha/beta fold hydrolase [Hyphomicrobiaceae bacterium]|nr:alpha/beta fold hydrolase [Hyphomicrobiaceae bacterium]